MSPTMKIGRSGLLRLVAVLIVGIGAVCFSGAGFAAKPAPEAHVITIRDFSFNPRSLTVNVGDRIEWKNADIVTHTVQASNGAFSSGDIEAGKSWIWVAKKAGSFAYSCSPHPNMHASLIVK